MSQFIRFLLQGLAVVTHTLETCIITIESRSFHLLDVITYGAIVGSVLRFISAHYRSYRGEYGQKVVERKV